MTRDEWVVEFVEELLRLRPYLRPKYGSSRLAWTLGRQAYAADKNPVDAAAAQHARMGPLPKVNP